MKFHLKIFEFDSSYPTYEEWKRQKSYNNKFHVIFRSYPTYEEWKLIRNVCD